MSSQPSLQGKKRPLPTDDDAAQSSRLRKRPGGASRISTAEKEAVLKKQREREEEARKEVASRGVHDVVRQHYNAVPQRGRDWRKTDSRIKGLRSFNNWVKSTIIHKFSPNDNGVDRPLIRVLDIGCGKGGDLQKWQQAPQPVELLVGIDPAEVSIHQARERYGQLSSRGGRERRGGFRGGRSPRTFHAEFFAQDAFGQSIANIPIVQSVGFDPNSSSSRRGAGGFDVVSMMFCMHYAFESEAKTRGMLHNVAGSLRKGGRFIGAIPNSDVIRSRVEAFHQNQANILKSTKHNGSSIPAETPNSARCNSSRDQALPDSIAASDGDGNNHFGKKLCRSKEIEAGAAPTVDCHESLSELNPHINIGISSPARADLHGQSTPNRDIGTPLKEASQAAPGNESPLRRNNETTPDQDSVLGKTDGLSTPEQHGQTVAFKKTTVESPDGKSFQTESLADITHSQDRGTAPSSKPPPSKANVPTPPSAAEWGNSIYRVRFPGPTPKDGVFRPPFGWKYSYFMEEAVEEVPEYVVPWEAFRA